MASPYTMRSVAASQELANGNNNNNTLGFMGKTPLELAYMRRIVIREQKMHLILRKLEQDLPVIYLKTHMLIMSLWTLIVVSIQTVLIIFSSPLSYLCAGYWCGAFFLLCICLAGLLIKKKTYRLLIATSVCHFIGIFLSLGGIMVINAMDLALFTTSCFKFNDCIQGQHQYFCFVMIVLGVVGSVLCSLYVGIIEYVIFRESRALNSFYDSS